MNKICFIFLLGFSLRTHAALIDNQSNFESDLEVGMIMNVISQPTPMRGATAFEIPTVKAKFELTQAEGNSFHFTFTGTDNRDSNSKKFQLEAEKASVVLKSYFPSTFWLELGLIENPWNEVSEELWDFQFWGPSSNPALNRYKYLPTSEMGFNAHWNLSERFGTTLSVMNGESSLENEQGPKKDAQIIVWYEDETWQTSFGYLRGSYETDEPAISEKERQLFRLAYIWEPLRIAVELYKTRDPSRAITSLGLAEGLNLNSYVNQSIEGQGGSLTLHWRLSEVYTLRLREDQLNPALKFDDVAVISHIAAISYEPSQSTSFSLILLQTTHGLNHSNASKTDERALLALGMHF